MNIFVTSSCPRESARYLDNKRMIKMILESAQIMSTVQREYWGISNTDLYKSTHKNHPCVKWAAENLLHYYWLFSHFEELCNIYQEKYGKIHKCWNDKHLDLFFPIGLELKVKGIGWTILIPEHFVNCSRYKDEPNVFEAYKKTLQEKWVEDKLKK